MERRHWAVEAIHLLRSGDLSLEDSFTVEFARAYVMSKFARAIETEKADTAAWIRILESTSPPFLKDPQPELTHRQLIYTWSAVAAPGETTTRIRLGPKILWGRRN